MAKYEARYRCQLCGREMKPLKGKQTEVSEDLIPKLLDQIIIGQYHFDTELFITPMYQPHKCSDGSGGLAAFIGFKKIQ